MSAEKPAPATAPVPLHPAIVMAAALLPGIGQLLNRQATRAVTFVFFMLLFGWVSYQFTTPAHSFIGRHAGGFFIYAISIMDAYRWARYRWEIYFRQGAAADDAGPPSR